MPDLQTITVNRPITGACLVEAPQWRMADGGGPMEPPAPPPPSDDLRRELQQQQDELARRLALLDGIAERLHTLHEQTVANHSAQIARLAVEIARRILKHKVSQGDYAIQAIVEETLQEAPTRQNVVVHLHPEDLAFCRELQQQNPQSPVAGLELTADPSLGRGECLVETPKGIVQSFIEEHLERISEALQRVQ